MTDEETVLALRAFTDLVDTESSASPRRRERPIDDRPVLVIDTETTPDAVQALTFGSYRYSRRGRDGYRCVEVGLFYGNDLPVDQVAELQTYCATERATVARGGERTIQLMTLTQFVNRVFYPAAYQARAMVVAFNMGFDLTRIVADAGEGRRAYRGGFSLVPWAYPDKAGKVRASPARPRLGVRILDSTKGFFGFLPPYRGGILDEPDEPTGRRYVFPGHFLDLRTLVFALTNEKRTLASACKRFGVKHGKTDVAEHGVVNHAYIAYNLRDTLATEELLTRVMAEFRRHPIPLNATKAYSPAAIAKGYLRAMGLVSPSEKFANVSADLRGIAMTAYFGGRAEVRIRKQVVPVVHCDFRSMYPTVNTLMGLWRLLVAERLEIEDATASVRTWLEAATPDACFDPAFWTTLPVFALLEPRGEILPVRCRYERHRPDFNIGINPLTSRTPVWFAGPDLVAAKLLSGRAPRVLQAVRLVGIGTQPNLRAVKLRGEVVVDPVRTDFFQRVIEARVQATSGGSASENASWLDAFLKVLANSGAYGIFAEMNRTRLAVGELAEIAVYGLDGRFTARTNGPEEPGPYCFPPIAALIPSAARLMLALLEHSVRQAGGTYAMCDTDSMAIVANERGGRVPCPNPSRSGKIVRQTVKALSWAEVGAIVDRFAALNPYDRSIVPGSILKIEKENYVLDDKGRPTSARRQLYCYAISAKRYVLFNQGRRGAVVIRKPSEHGLGHLLNPLAKREREFDTRDWITRVWEWIVGSALGRRPGPLTFTDRIAMSRYTVSTPRLWRPFQGSRWEAPYQGRVKPGNFVLSPHVMELGSPTDADPQRFHLIAPYNPDPDAWPRTTCIEIYSRTPYAITTTGPAGRRVVRVKTYGDVLGKYLVHPEPKSLAPSGRPCGPHTRGVLRRRPVITRLPPIYVGKESNQLEEVEQGLVHEFEEVQEIYVDPRVDPWRTDVIPVLKYIPTTVLARAAGVTPRAIKAIRNQHNDPSPEHRQRLVVAARSYAQRIIRDPKAAGDVRVLAHRLLESPVVGGAPTRNPSPMKPRHP